MVDWFNSVDATYRQDLQSINDRNLGLFDAKLEQRLAEFAGVVRAETDLLRTELKSDISKLARLMNARFEANDTRFGTFEESFVAIDARFDATEANFGTLEAKIDARFALSDERTNARVTSEIGKAKTELIKWMFVFWTGMTVTNIGTMFALAKLLG